MNEFPPIASPTTESPQSNVISLRALANARRWVWAGVVAHVVSMFAAIANQNLSTTSAPAAPDVYQVLLLLLQIASAAFCALVVGKLTSALKLKWGWVAIILSLFSLLGLFVLLSLNKLATRKLRAGGYRIGTFKTGAP